VLSLDWIGAAGCQGLTSKSIKEGLKVMRRKMYHVDPDYAFWKVIKIEDDPGFVLSFGAEKGLSAI